MKSRTKLIAVIVGFVLAIGATFGITYGIMAAQNATVSTPVDVGYTSHEVAATVSGTWQRATDANATAFETAGGDNSITFTGAEATANGAFTGVDTDLASNNASIVFTFTFVNNGSGTFNAVVTLPATQTNVTVVEKEVTGSGDVDLATAHTLTVAGGATKTYKVTVSITNVALDAAFTGSFGWTLTNVA